jgi:hypothetical protein
MCSQNIGSNDNISENISNAALGRYKTHLGLMAAVSALIERTKASQQSVPAFTPKNPIVSTESSPSHRATPSF